MDSFKYDFGLSFAGEDRKYANKLAELLIAEGVKVFYDYFEEDDLWGKNLYTHFQKVYGQECRYFIPFISKNYVEKNWPKHELVQAQAREFKSDAEYILPLRLDDTFLPGLNETIGYIDLRNKSIQEVSELCLSKILKNSTIRQLYLFLRNNNPMSILEIKKSPDQLLIRVAHSKVNELKSILSKIPFNVLSGEDQNNILMNGGYGPQGCIPSNDSEPHTTFLLTLTSEFYKIFPN